MQTDQPDPGTQEPAESLTCQQVTDAIIDYLTGDMQPETTTQLGATLILTLETFSVSIQGHDFTR